MSAIRLPKTIDQAVERLTGVESLLTATEWERAAIVYTFTEIRPQGERTDLASSSKVRIESVSAFAARGIAGLKSKDTVRRYHEAWAEYGDINIQPGSQVDLPTATFPASPDSNYGKRVSPAKAHKLVSEWSAPAVEAATDEISNRLDELSDETVEQLAQNVHAEQTKRHPREAQPPLPEPLRPDYNKMTRDAVYNVFVALIAENENSWTPDDKAEAYLGLLLRRLSDRQTPSESIDSLIAEIEDHLQTEAAKGA